MGTRQTREGRGEDPMESPMETIPFVGVFATRLLGLYYDHGDVTTLASRPWRPHWVLNTSHDRTPTLGVCFEHAQNNRRDSAIIGDHGDPSGMSGVSTGLIPRLLRPRWALDTFYIAVATQ